MPLIFTKETEETWIKNDINKNLISELMAPLDEKLMSAHTIKKVCPKTVNVFAKETIEEFVYPELELRI